VSRLLLVRHGQASFGADDYDVLSPLGREQARVLGRHLAGLAPPDAIYVGPRRRQQDTLAEMAAAAGPLPPAQTLEALDEYPAIELFRRHLPELARRDPELAASLARGQAGRGEVQRALEDIVGRWARGELDTGELETFAAFQARVHGALDAIARAEGRGKTVWAVTSGGPIALAVQRCLGLADTAALGLAWVIGNGSWSELRYSAGRLGLHGFNHLTHLSRDLVTYR
jgi:broad specificity phosphatase PhoE